MAGAVRLAPPSQRLTRRRSRILPVNADGSSSGPSSSSTASVLRSTAAGYPRDRDAAHGSGRLPPGGLRDGPRLPAVRGAGAIMAGMATDTSSSIVPAGDRSPSSWGLGDGQ